MGTVVTEVRVGISVDGTAENTTAMDTSVHDLRRRLSGEPHLRGRLRPADSAPPPGAMGLPGEALLALLEPGGVVTTFAAGLITWLAARRSECTVSITRPDGTQITLTSTSVKNQTPQERAEFIRGIAAALDEGGAETSAATDDEVAAPDAGTSGRTAARGVGSSETRAAPDEATPESTAAPDRTSETTPTPNEGTSQQE